MLARYNIYLKKERKAFAPTLITKGGKKNPNHAKNDVMSTQ